MKPLKPTGSENREVSLLRMKSTQLVAFDDLNEIQRLAAICQFGHNDLRGFNYVVSYFGKVRGRVLKKK